MEYVLLQLIPLSRGVLYALLPIVGVIIILHLQKKTKYTFKQSILGNLVEECPTHSVLNLLPEEKKRHLKTPSISTVTFYEGASPRSHVEQRVKAIVSANPFLRCRLVQLTDSEANVLNSRYGTSSGVCAVYPTEYKTSEALECFQFVKDAGVSNARPYAELVQQVKKYNVPLGEVAIDKDLPLFCVTLIEVEENKKYCMMVSLCHTIADGFTFYKLYSMLSTTTPVTSIDIERVTEFSQELSGNLNFGTAWWELPFVIWGSLCNKYLQPRMQARVCLINNEYVQAEKNTYTATQTKPPHSDNSNNSSAANKPQYLSTNDIVTSWFFRFSDVDLGFMIANFRGRKRYLSETHGGNYQGRILFLRSDMQKPESVRESIVDFRPTSGAIPTIPVIAGMNIALITNWATFYTDVEYPQCKQVIHLPVIDVSDAVLRQCLVIFQANTGTLGVILWTRGIEQSQFDKERILRPL